MYIKVYKCILIYIRSTTYYIYKTHYRRRCSPFDRGELRYYRNHQKSVVANAAFVARDIKKNNQCRKECKGRNGMNTSQQLSIRNEHHTNYLAINPTQIASKEGQNNYLSTVKGFLLNPSYLEKRNHNKEILFPNPN